jgi:predicted MPP superfamily phosphohydrolase
VTLATFISRFTVVIVIWMSVHAYLGWKLLRPVRGRKRLALALLGVLVAAAPPFMLWADRAEIELPMKDPLRWIGYGCIVFSSLLAFWFLCEDCVRFAAWLVRLRRPRPAVPVDADRRAFLRNSVNLGLVTAAGGYTAVGAGNAQDTPAAREVEVPVANLPAGLEGFRIVQITDLHLGGTIRREYVERVVQAANALSPDLVAVTGDLVDGQVADWREEAAPLGTLRSTYGTFFVTGNHEYYWDPHGWLAELESLGWQLLLNEHRVIEKGGGRILLAGVTDYRSARYVPEHVSDPAKARDGAPPCDVSILLAHQPKSIFAASKAAYDLQISGHTHGGQYFPINLLVHFFEPYVSGLHKHDNTWIYVSRGTGYWGPPNRLGVPKEIAVLKLVRLQA